MNIMLHTCWDYIGQQMFFAYVSLVQFCLGDSKCVLS